MPEIRSANPDFPRLSGPGGQSYTHPASRRQGKIPLAFQVTSPFHYWRALLPHALVMHVNPQSFQLTHNKVVERIQTRGGWVEQHWGDQLDEIRGDGSTGAFMNIYTGLTSVLRQRTIAWDRFRDLHDLYRNNGSVYDPSGRIVLQGNIMLMYDQGVYSGSFRTFEFEETADSPFAFQVTWAFKVETTIWKMPMTGGRPIWGPSPRVPSFQGRNTQDAPNAVAHRAALAAAAEEQAKLDAAQQLGERLGSAVVRNGNVVIQTAKDIFNQTAIGQALAKRASDLDTLRKEREERMRAATGAPPPEVLAAQERDRQREAHGLPRKSTIPTQENADPNDPAAQLGLGPYKEPRSL